MYNTFTSPIFYSYDLLPSGNTSCPSRLCLMSASLCYKWPTSLHPVNSCASKHNSTVDLSGIFLFHLHRLVYLLLFHTFSPNAHCLLYYYTNIQILLFCICVYLLIYSGVSADCFRFFCLFVCLFAFQPLYQTLSHNLKSVNAFWMNKWMNHIFSGKRRDRCASP